MESVLLLIENNFEDTEALYPYYRMKEAGFGVVVVGAKAGTYASKHGYPLKAEKTPGEIDVKKFKALLIPGGGAPDRMRVIPEMVRLVREASEHGLVVAAICHGPQMLIEADVVRGKKATCYASVKTDLVNAGAKYEDSPVVVDGRLVTSRVPGDLPDFCRAILERLSRG
ncbi:MAG: type 1 glutamine amidotransferase [Deltaproteobacteria bacterium]|nr:type 1 glutamine amidotransferase [Deltaproteobacteria bacterium]